MDPGEQYTLKFDANASAGVDAYLEYKRIVGNDDRGRTFAPEEYEAYIERVKPMRLQNRLYVSWMNTEGMDCKLIGPETPCFCTHRYISHNSDYATIPPERPVPLPCTESGCGCVSFFYSPKLGNQIPRCGCKHSPDDHCVTKPPYKCRKDKCSCPGFRTAIRCGCGQLATDHRMHVETKSERLARGRPVGQDVLYKGMGGLTGFSSLMDGYMRLDDSGIGAPPPELLDRAITSSDDPFLRSHAKTLAARGVSGVQQEVASATKRPGESDMDYFERRYQERQKAERHIQAAPSSRPAVTSKDAKQLPGGSGLAVKGCKPKQKPTKK